MKTTLSPSPLEKRKKTVFRLTVNKASFALLGRPKVRRTETCFLTLSMFLLIVKKYLQNKESENSLSVDTYIIRLLQLMK